MRSLFKQLFARKHQDRQQKQHAQEAEYDSLCQYHTHIGTNEKCHDAKRKKAEKGGCSR